VSASATVLAAAVRGGGAVPVVVTGEDLRADQHEQRGDHVVVLAVDASGSMGAASRVAAAREAALMLLADAYQRRDRVALVVYRDHDARVLLRPTSSTEVALTRLEQISTGGRTPLSAGIDAACALAGADRRAGARALLVLISDGRATWAGGGADPFEAALGSARAVAKAGIDALVIDCELGERPLGLARVLAEEMGARYVSVRDAAETGELGAEVVVTQVTRSLSEP
jgi:magnesium chelatase subunit D